MDYKKVSYYFPSLGISSNTASKPLQALYNFSKKDIEKYTTFSLFSAFIISLIVVFSLYALSIKFDIIGFYTLSFLLLFSVLFYLFLSMPSYEYKRRIKNIEFELPFVARILGAFIESKVPFSTSLERAISFAHTLKSDLNIKSKVISTKALLTDLYKRYNTPMIQRFTAYVLSVYETGTQGSKLINLSDDLFSVVRSKLSDNSSKLSLMSMVFVAVLVLLPTFLLIISAVLNLPIVSSQSGAFLLFFIAIPFLSIILVVFSSSFVIKHVKLPYLEFFIIYFVGLVTYLLFSTKLMQAGIVLGSVVILFLLFRSRYLESKRLEKINGLIPDGLMTLESLNQGVFRTLAHSNLGELSKEAAKSYNQIKSHVSEKKALDDFYKRNPTKNVGIFCKVIQTAYELGSMKHVYGIAESIFKNEEISRYAQQLNSMQRYTLMLGVFLLPMLLSMSSNVVHAMSNLGGTVSGIDINSILIPYMLIYDVLSALYIAQVTEKSSEFYTNLIIFTIISIAVVFIF